MKAGASHAMAPVQAELQIRDWSTYLVDRGAEGGSWVQGPAAQDWEQLGRNEQRELANGSHLSCGGRVLTLPVGLAVVGGGGRRRTSLV